MEGSSNNTQDQRKRCCQESYNNFDISCLNPCPTTIVLGANTIACTEDEDGLDVRRRAVRGRSPRP